MVFPLQVDVNFAPGEARHIDRFWQKVRYAGDLMARIL
jgi:hypothetical protein